MSTPLSINATTNTALTNTTLKAPLKIDLTEENNNISIFPEINKTGIFISETDETIPNIGDLFKEDDFKDVSEEDKKSIDTLIEGEKELEEIKEESAATLKKAGYSEEEIEQKLSEIEAKYVEENSDYAEAKEKFGNLEEDYNKYIDEKIEEWTEKHPVPDKDATKKEWDEYYDAREEYESALNQLYLLDNPEYAYYKYSKDKHDVFANILGKIQKNKNIESN